MMGQVLFRRGVAPFVAVAVSALLVTLAAGPSALADGDAGPSGVSTNSTSTKHITTTKRVDLEDAPALECDDPGSPAALVDQTSQALDPSLTVTQAVGPTTIMIGEDQQTPYVVPNGDQNIDTLTTYETVVTQYFQATAAGPPCAVVVEARFTG